MVPRVLDQHMTEFILETGLTLEQAQRITEEIPKVEVVGVPYEHGKPFITYEE